MRKSDGWTTVSLPDDVEAVTVTSGQTDSQFSLTLIDIRSGTEIVYVYRVLDVGIDVEEKLSSEMPRTDSENEPAVGPARVGMSGE